ncbi:2Fe-2S iron-sulfur cluster-binding protein [Mycobacterium sp. pUA109]|uniref:2Fe-2S iron-sulfur cluster-binding protein n=1 Tax=Mycobacterium sp. pUA109 TaxID=3238982 RepID=UPI00351B5C50
MHSATELQPAGAAVGGDACCPEGLASVRVKHVVRETGDAVSLVLEVPRAHAHRFRYEAGQFLTVHVRINGEDYRRCYSMSSSPAVSEDIRITVKRDGVVSNWLNDTTVAGDELRVAPPAGRFVLAGTERELVAFAGGSGITPVYSLIRTALATTARRARLFYANRSRESVIFREALQHLAETNRERLRLHHHLDEHAGTVTPADVAGFVTDAADADYYICGPAQFMETVEAAVLAAGAPAERVHVERFTLAPLPAPEAAESPVPDEVTIVLDRRSTTVGYRAGSTVLQTARLAGLSAPSSCEVGSCGTCMARVTEGSVRMLNNQALDDDEIGQGWILTCQSLPTSPRLRVVYE